MGKPKSNQRGDQVEGADGRDLCMTPDYAIDLILPHLEPGMVIWEPCAGEGHMVRYLRGRGFTVIASELRTSNVLDTPYTGRDALTWQPPEQWHIALSNFPFSVKYDLIVRFLSLGKPWASLVPSDTLFAASAYEPFVETYERTGKGIELLIPKGRISYKMPNKGWGGSAQFHSIWLGWNMGMPALPMDAYVAMARREQDQIALPLQLATPPVMLALEQAA